MRRTTTVEFEGSLKGDSFLGRLGLCVALLCGVEAVDVGLVVLAVVKLHDLLGDEGLERIVGVGEVGESVGHVFLSVAVDVGGVRGRRPCTQRIYRSSSPSRRRPEDST